MKFVKIFFLLLILANKASAQEQPKFFAASINPVYQILVAITQEGNNSVLIINPGFSEHNYQLKKSDIDFLNKATLIFYVDDELEVNLSKAIKTYHAELKSYKLTSIKGLRLLQNRNNPVKTDLHIWLNPQNAVKIAEFICERLSAADPQNSQKYFGNLLKFKKEMAQTEKILKAQFASIEGKDYIFYHDGYQYLEEYFGVKPLKIISFDHDRELDVKSLRELDSLVAEHQVKCIFGEAYDEKNSSRKLAEKYKMKFQVLDLIGPKKNTEENLNGYSLMLRYIANDMVSCLRN